MSVAEKLKTIAENQQKVYQAGFYAGDLAGQSTGYDVGFSEGKQSEWSKFWDALQKNGTRQGYNYAFYGGGWTDENFRPKYDLKPTEFSQAFNSTGITDMAACLNACGVTLDTSGTGGFSYTFFNSSITHLPVISTVGASKISYTFYQAMSLHTIDKLILKDDGSQTFESAFYCPALQNIVIEGVLGNAVSFSNSPKLTHDSLMSIINALKDYSGTTTTKKLTFGTTNLAKLTDAEKTIATGKGWTLV